MFVKPLLAAITWGGIVTLSVQVIARSQDAPAALPIVLGLGALGIGGYVTVEILNYDSDIRLEKFLQEREEAKANDAAMRKAEQL